MPCLDVTVDSHIPLHGTSFERIELTAVRNGVRYFVAAVRRKGGEITIVDLRRHGSTRRTQSRSMAYCEVHQAVERVLAGLR